MLALVCLWGEDVTSQRLEALEVRGLGLFVQLPDDGLSVQVSGLQLVKALCIQEIEEYTRNLQARPPCFAARSNKSHAMRSSLSAA